MLNALYLLLGIGLLTIGGEALIRGALAVANRLGVSPLFSGLVIVGFGTSMPEMIVSIEAALGEKPDIAIGNVVGSNVANILLILGLCAVITPLTVSALALRRDAVTVIAASLLFIFLAIDSSLSHQDAAILLLSLIAYLLWAYWSEKRDLAAASDSVHQAEAAEVSLLPKSAGLAMLAIATGLVFLMVGSKVLLIGAVGIAQGLGVSEAVIGLTLVAVGTSLPELTISVIAAIRRHTDVAVGNILGSNIFNLLGILGVSALLQPLQVHVRILEFDQWVMLGVAVLLMVFLYTGRRLNRLEGSVLLIGYFVYIGASYLTVGG
jgi:cation:H+ antiporter